MARVSVKPAPGKAGLAGTGHFNQREEKGVLPQVLTLRLSPRGVLGPGGGEPCRLGATWVEAENGFPDHPAVHEARG